MRPSTQNALTAIPQGRRRRDRRRRDRTVDRLASACRGMSVAVFERGEAGSGTMLAATGMLAAAAEHESGGEETSGVLRWKASGNGRRFRAAVEAAGNSSIDYRDEGTLVVALGRDEVERPAVPPRAAQARGASTQIG